jgi:hypothetical protein
MKIKSKSPGRLLVRLQGKLKLKKKKKSTYSYVLIIFFSELERTGHEPISVTDLGCSVSHVKPLVSSCLQDMCFFLKILLGGEGAAARQSLPLGRVNGSTHP